MTQLQKVHDRHWVIAGRLRSQRLASTVRFFALGVLAILTTSGCSPDLGGMTGISVDAGGNPVAVLILCAGAVDGINVYTNEGEQAHDVGTWETATPVSGEQSVNLISPPVSWHPSMTMQPLREDVEYTMFAGTTSNRWATTAVTFTTEVLRRLQPGQVLHQEYDDDLDDDRDVVVDADTFKAKACEGY